MTYEYGDSASDDEIEIAERISEMLFNEFDHSADDYLVTVNDDGTVTVQVADGIGEMDL
jgi:hypothetical protein